MATELWLNFTDENGEAKRVLVEGEKFAIGRTPENNLQIPLSNLSRQHAKIERFADVFVVSDNGSSNGSFLNGEKIEKPIGLKNGDKLNLGDGVEIEIELVSDTPQNSAPPPDDDEEEGGETSGASAASASAGSSGSSSGANSIPTGCFIAAPILAILAVLVLGGVVLFMNSGGGTDVSSNENKGGFVYSNNTEDDTPEPSNQKSPENTQTATPTPITGNSNQTNNSTPSNVTTTTSPTQETTVTTTNSSDTEKIEINGNACLRRIAQNDPRAFLTGKQVGILSGKISQFKGSGVLVDNLKSAKKSASQIQSLAQSKNLKPQFLMLAALTKLGNQRGDVLTTAQGMADVLQNLSVPIGTEFGNDSLLTVAAYEQGVAGQNLAMRDLLARECLPEKNPGVNCREIRSIWFLKDKGKIDDSQFEFALRFLAIGTIAQNPKDFGIQTDAVVLN